VSKEIKKNSRREEKKQRTRLSGLKSELLVGALSKNQVVRPEE
jgi:hypothetical protein